MSVCSIRHNFRVLHLIEDLLAIFCPEGVPLVATDLVAINDIIVAASGVLIEENTLQGEEALRWGELFKAGNGKRSPDCLRDKWNSTLLLKPATLAGRWLVSWIRVSLPLRSKIRQGSFQSQPLWRLNGSICLTTFISQKLSVLLKGGVAVGGVVALAVAHVVEVVMDVVETIYVRERRVLKLFT